MSNGSYDLFSLGSKEKNNRQIQFLNTSKNSIVVIRLPNSNFELSVRVK